MAIAPKYTSGGTPKFKAGWAQKHEEYRSTHRKNELPIVIKHIAVQTEIAGDLKDWANEIGIE
jgi:hypothetical protein